MRQRQAGSRRSLARLGGAIVVLAAAAPAHAAEAPPPAITIEGEASEEIAPDMARLSLGVEAERPTAAAATAAVAAAAQAVTAELKAENIADKDVATTALALAPVYPDDQPGQPRAPRAFRAGTTFRILVRPAERAGLLASALVDKGANIIEGIDYGSSHEAERLDALRADAMRDALRKAQIYTGALGLHLGPVLEIAPSGQQSYPRGGMRPAAMAAKMALPTAPGTLSLQTSVTVRWAIAP